LGKSTFSLPTKAKKSFKNKNYPACYLNFGEARATLLAIFRKNELVGTNKKKTWLGLIQ
jgi:hypothetical protein